MLRPMKCTFLHASKVTRLRSRSMLVSLKFPPRFTLILKRNVVSNISSCIQFHSYRFTLKRFIREEAVSLFAYLQLPMKESVKTGVEIEL